MKSMYIRSASQSKTLLFGVFRIKTAILFVLSLLTVVFLLSPYLSSKGIIPWEADVSSTIPMFGYDVPFFVIYVGSILLAIPFTIIGGTMAAIINDIKGNN